MKAAPWLLSFVLLAVAWWLVSGRSETQPTNVPASATGLGDSAAEREHRPVPSDVEASPSREPADTGTSLPEEITGRVCNDARRPVAGAAVRAFVSPKTAGSPVLAEVTSDADGAFRFAWGTAWPTKVVLEAAAPGHATTTRAHIGPGSPVEFFLSRVVVIRGRVLDSDTHAPLEGAVVRSSTTATTDASGQYEVRAELQSRNTFVQATHPGHVEQGRSLRLQDPDPVDLDLYLPRSESLLVQVVDAETGAPIAGARVDNQRGDAGTNTDERGQCRLTTGNGVYLSRVVSAAQHGETTWNWRVRDASSTVPRIPLFRLATVEGRVTDADGAPAVGARVGLLNGMNRECVRTNLPSPGPGTFSFSDGGATAKTNTEGRFELAVLPSPTASFVRVSRGDLPPVCSAAFVLDRPEAMVHIDLVLVAGGTIRGIVQRNGTPMANARIFWQSVGSDPVDGWIAVKGDGNYELVGVAAGDVKVRLLDGAEILHRCTLRITAGETLRHDIAVDEHIAPITGRITSSNGLPLANIVVHAFSEAADGYMRKATSDEDGRYSIPCAAGCKYTVRVRLESAERCQTGVAAGSQGIDLTMPELGLLRLVVHDAATHAPCTFEDDPQSWSLAWRTAGERVFVQAKERIDSRGRVDLRLPVGAVDVSLWTVAAGHAPRTVSNLSVTNDPEPAVTPIEVGRGIDIDVTLAPDTPMSREVLAGHVVFLLDDREAAMVRGPFAVESVESNHRINGVNMWFDEPGLLHRLVPFGAPYARPMRGLTAGRRRLRAFPDDIVFEPAEIDVTPAGGTFAVRWHRR